jgi:hypothetical protein
VHEAISRSGFALNEELLPLREVQLRKPAVWMDT